MLSYTYPTTRIIKQRTGSASWPQFAKVTNQVTRLDVRWTAYCERPSLFNSLKSDMCIDAGTFILITMTYTYDFFLQYDL